MRQPCLFLQLSVLLASWALVFAQTYTDQLMCSSYQCGAGGLSDYAAGTPCDADAFCCIPTCSAKYPSGCPSGYVSKAGITFADTRCTSDCISVCCDPILPCIGSYVYPPVACGNGTANAVGVYIVSRAATNNGAACEVANGTTLSSTFKQAPCPDFCSNYTNQTAFCGSTGQYRPKVDYTSISCPSGTCQKTDCCDAAVRCEGLFVNSTCNDANMIPIKCGNGTIRSNFSIYIPAQFGGKECANKTGDYIDYPCNMGTCQTCGKKACPTGYVNKTDIAASTICSTDADCTATCCNPVVDCVGINITAPCTTTCGTGIMLTTFTVTIPAMNGGAACKFENGAVVQNKTCNTDACPPICSLNYNGTCNTGRTPRSEYVACFASGGCREIDCCRDVSKCSSYTCGSGGPNVSRQNEPIQRVCTSALCCKIPTLAVVDDSLLTQRFGFPINMSDAISAANGQSIVSNLNASAALQYIQATGLFYALGTVSQFLANPTLSLAGHPVIKLLGLGSGVTGMIAKVLSLDSTDVRTFLGGIRGLSGSIPWSSDFITISRFAGDGTVIKGVPMQLQMPCTNGTLRICRFASGPYAAYCDMRAIVVDAGSGMCNVTLPGTSSVVSFPPAGSQTAGPAITGICGEWTNQSQWTIGSYSVKQTATIDLNCTVAYSPSLAVATTASISSAIVTVSPGSTLSIINVISGNREIRINGILVLAAGSFLNATLRVGNTGSFGKQAVIPVLSYTGASSDFKCSDTLTNGVTATVNPVGCPAGYTCTWTATTPVPNSLCVLSVQLDQIPVTVVTTTGDSSNPSLFALFALLALPIIIALMVCWFINTKKKMNAEKSQYVDETATKNAPMAPPPAQYQYDMPPAPAPSPVAPAQPSAPLRF